MTEKTRFFVLLGLLMLSIGLLLFLNNRAQTALL